MQEKEVATMKSFEELLKESVAGHGHLCAGQVIGVRMAMLGCRLIGIEDPKNSKWRKKVMVYVEIDRCATDAIQSVTGCRMGKRTLKFRDFGINAATFLNLETKQAYRIVSTEESRKLADAYAPEEPASARRQLIGYQRMPDEELFSIQPVRVPMEAWEMPGPPRRKATCIQCGQVIRDGREIDSSDKVLCRPCAGMSYCIPLDVDQTRLPLTQMENVS
jgi:formylmethanofuran dehydrogenase subunit E